MWNPSMKNDFYVCNGSPSVYSSYATTPVTYTEIPRAGFWDNNRGWAYKYTNNTNMPKKLHGFQVYCCPVHSNGRSWLCISSPSNVVSSPSNGLGFTMSATMYVFNPNGVNTESSATLTINMPAINGHNCVYDLEYGVTTTANTGTLFGLPNYFGIPPYINSGSAEKMKAIQPMFYNWTNSPVSIPVGFTAFVQLRCNNWVDVSGNTSSAATWVKVMRPEQFWDGFMFSGNWYDELTEGNPEVLKRQTSSAMPPVWVADRTPYKWDGTQWVKQDGTGVA